MEKKKFTRVMVAVTRTKTGQRVTVSLFGGHLGRNRTLAQLSYRFYWSGMSDDVKDWLRQCTT